MIERLLAAENALDRGDVDTAGLLFTQVAQADPKNVIAIVGLARVALREDRITDARDLAEEALEIDPHEAAAQRILREVLAEVRPAPEPAVAAPKDALAAPEPMPAAPEPEPWVESPEAGPAAPTPAPVAGGVGAPSPRLSLLARLRRWIFGDRA